MMPDRLSGSAISPPLPLPVHFTLLPSPLPSRTLAALLYTLVNGIPVYLTLSPAQEPHVSLLPLVLALFPSSPLHLIKLLPRDYVSLDLRGNAPFVDIWVPLPIAKTLIEKLEVERLFWDEAKPGAGLLGQADAITWEEDEVICHNWLPSSSAISTSSYSLSTLLSTPFGRTDIIPEDRYITTRIDPARRAKLVLDAETADLSQIRGGEWGTAWTEYLRWTLQAWDEYCRFPSRPPPSPSPLLSSDQAVLARGIASLLPLISRLGTSSSVPAHPLALSDISSLLSIELRAEPSTANLALRLFWRLAHKIPIPFRRRALGSRGISLEMLKALERRARVQLSIVEFVGIQLVDTFSRSHVFTKAELVNAEGSVLSNRNAGSAEHQWTQPMPRGLFTSRGRGVESARRDLAEDALDELERRRGSSPPFSSMPDAHRGGQTGSPPVVERDASIACDSRGPEPRLTPQYSSNPFYDPLTAAGTTTPPEANLGKPSTTTLGVSRSEDTAGWWAYGSVFAAILVAVLLGMSPV